MFQEEFRLHFAQSDILQDNLPHKQMRQVCLQWAVAVLGVCLYSPEYVADVLPISLLECSEWPIVESEQVFKVSLVSVKAPTIVSPVLPN